MPSRESRQIHRASGQLVSPAAVLTRCHTLTVFVSHTLLQSTNSVVQVGPSNTMKVALAACCLAVCVFATCTAASNPNCDPSYDCLYTYVDPSASSEYTYDFSSLCSATDYVLSDKKGHVYYANICGTARQNCLPGACRTQRVSRPDSRVVTCVTFAFLFCFSFVLACCCSFLEEHVRVWRCCAELGCHACVQPQVTQLHFGQRRASVLHCELPGVGDRRADI